jgi:hypothetical protein
MESSPLVAGQEGVPLFITSQDVTCNINDNFTALSVKPNDTKKRKRFNDIEYERNIDDTFIKLVRNAKEMTSYLLSHRNVQVIILCQVGDISGDAKLAACSVLGKDAINSIILDVYNAAVSELDAVALKAYQLWHGLLMVTSLDNQVQKGHKLTSEEIEICEIIRDYVKVADNVKYFDKHIVTMIADNIKSLI